MRLITMCYKINYESIFQNVINHNSKACHSMSSKRAQYCAAFLFAYKIYRSTTVSNADNKDCHIIYTMNLKNDFHYCKAKMKERKKKQKSYTNLTQISLITAN